jgi:prepilin peptidase CpaA
MFEQAVGRVIAGGIYTMLLAVAAVSDARSRRIPNVIVAAIALGGLVFSMATLSPLPGLRFAGGGLATGLAIWMPFYVIRWMGAGDVKLAAAVGAWLGAVGVAHASLVAAIVGGGIALAMMLWQRSLAHVATDMVLLVETIRRRPTRVRVRPVTGDRQLMPYGLALVAGALAVGWLGV